MARKNAKGPDANGLNAKGPDVSRRKFVTGVALTGAATAVAPQVQAAVREAEVDADRYFRHMCAAFATRSVRAP